MLRNKTTYFLPFCFFEMDENTKKENTDHGCKGQKNRKTRRNIGKVLKKRLLKLRKSNKLVYMFNLRLTNKITKGKINSTKQCWINLKSQI